MQEPATLYALRLFDIYELITDENFRRKINENEQLNQCRRCCRNTLAFTLTSMHSLIKHDHGWDDLDFNFINKDDKYFRKYLPVEDLQREIIALSTNRVMNEAHGEELL
ncbi:hypothetical protein GLOIN_2v1752839 [Rhizophagus clarus]|uniref:Uncharacterized protein n=1 Tax=Rhizophagus clarus TaxID=94130 RepID=A0A8H3KYN8_9GLOM|nr:hypothetical protein GLOIN_2v1752839 [Rhizophagus clarus]